MNHSHQQNDCRANMTYSEEMNKVQFHLSEDRGEVGGERRGGVRKLKEGGTAGRRVRWRVKSTRQKHLRLPKDGVKGNPVLIVQPLPLLCPSIHSALHLFEIDRFLLSQTIQQVTVWSVTGQDQSCLLWLQLWSVFVLPLPIAYTVWPRTMILIKSWLEKDQILVTFFKQQTMCWFSELAAHLCYFVILLVKKCKRYDYSLSCREEVESAKLPVNAS